MRSLGIAIAVVLVSQTARADTTNLDLTWEAPAGCASRAEIVERVGRLLGDGTRARQNVRVRAIVSEAADHQSYRADLELASVGEAGAHRIVEGESCPAVADAVVTIVALAIDPEAAASAPPPLPTSPPRAARPTRPLQLSIGAAARVDIGSVPATVFGGQAFVGVSWYHFGLDLDGSLLASARATLPGNDSEGADISLREIGGRLSHSALFGPLEVGLRAGLHARWLSANGFGAAETRDGLTLFGVLSFGALAKYHFGTHVAVRAAVDLGIPLSRPTFAIDSARVYEVGPESLALAVGPELIF